MPQNTGASAEEADRATRASPKPASGLGHKASVPCAFTSGPWRFRPHDGGFIVVRNYRPGDGSLVTEFVAECRGKPNVPNEANARLIAAAPELYEALETLVSFARHNATIGKAYVDDAEAALAKARGDLA